MVLAGRRHSRDCPGYFLRLTPDRVQLGAGRYAFDKATLEAFRAAVADEGRGTALERALEEVRAKGAEVGGAHYKRVPRGFDADHARADLLRYNALHAWIEESFPLEAHTAEFVEYCSERFGNSRRCSVGYWTSMPGSEPTAARGSMPR